MLKIGDIIEVLIEKVVFGGEGLAYYNNMAIFVPMSAIGDKLNVRIISVKKTYARGLIEKIIEKSSDRANDIISFEDGNGCDFSMLKYEKQIEYKDNMLKEMFFHMCKEDISGIYEGINKAENPYHYRNKVAKPFFKKDGKILVGFYKRKSHEKFESDDILQSEISKKIEKKVLEKLNESDLTIYSENTKQGFLKHLILRNNQNDDLMLAIVVNKKSRLNKLKKILEDLYNENENIKSVYVSIKNKEDNIILGEENIHLFGAEYISENIFDIDFKIYLDSFFQINIEQVKKLYNKAISNIDSSNVCIDAYSGTGTIAMILSKKSKKVHAIELIKSASDSGLKTAEENEIKNIIFHNDKVENRINKILKKEKIDFIVFDPPRKGLDTLTIKNVCDSNISKIIYISCEPSRFARDYNLFKERGYKLKKIDAVDMFPNTHHIETVALLEK